MKDRPLDVFVPAPVRALLAILWPERWAIVHDFTAADHSGAPVMQALRKREGGMAIPLPYEPCPSCGVLVRGAHACAPKPAKEARSKPADRRALAEEAIEAIKSVQPVAPPQSAEEMVRERLEKVVPIRRERR